MTPQDKCIVRDAVDCDGKPYGWREVLYWCPACQDVHDAPLREGGRTRPSWVFNEDTLLPTLVPSINYTTRLCHHTVTSGVIKFCDECPKMGGQSVPLLTLAEWPPDVLNFYGGSK